MAKLKNVSLSDKGYVQSHNYNKNLTGFNITNEGDAEFARLFVRDYMEVNELKFNKIKVSEDEQWITAAAKIKSCDRVTGIGGDPVYDITIDDGGDSNTIAPFDENDILKAIYNNLLSDDASPKTYVTHYFKVISVNNTIVRVISYKTSDDTTFSEPHKNMVIVRIGNTYDESRQKSILISSKHGNITFYDGVNTPAITESNVKMILGDTSGYQPEWLKPYGATGYSGVMEDIIITGKFFQIQKSDDGQETIIPVVTHRGDFNPTNEYSVYDTVSFSGRIYILDRALTVEDVDITPGVCDAWKIYLDKGGNLYVFKYGPEATGDIWHETFIDGDKWMQQFVDNTKVGDPIKIVGLDGIDGVDGKPGTDGVNGADGINGKDGISIIFKGYYAVPPPDPQDGWAYYNTTDKKSYVYQDNAWYQMCIDGVDGANGTNGTNGLSIKFMGEFTVAPENPEINWTYRNKLNNKVYIYNGNGWELMVADGTDGADGTNGTDGADGTNGLSVFITYHDSPITSPIPTKPHNKSDGNGNGWHTTPETACVWMSQKVAYTATDDVPWGNPIQLRGFDGADGTNGADGTDGTDGKPGADGKNGAILRTFKYSASQTYVNNDDYADYVYILNNGNYMWYSVPKGSSIIGVLPPASPWVGPISNMGTVATDVILANNANLAGFSFNNGWLESQTKDESNTPVLRLNGITGEIMANKGTFKGTINASSGTFGQNTKGEVFEIKENTIIGKAMNEYNKMNDRIKITTGSLPKLADLHNGTNIEKYPGLHSEFYTDVIYYTPTGEITADGEPTEQATIFPGWTKSTVNDPHILNYIDINGEPEKTRVLKIEAVYYDRRLEYKAGGAIGSDTHTSFKLKHSGTQKEITLKKGVNYINVKGGDTYEIYIDYYEYYCNDYFAHIPSNKPPLGGSTGLDVFPNWEKVPGTENYEPIPLGGTGGFVTNIEVFDGISQTIIANDGFCSYWGPNTYFYFSKSAGLLQATKPVTHAETQEYKILSLSDIQTNNYPEGLIYEDENGFLKVTK